LPKKLVSYLKRENYYKRKKIQVNKNIIREIIKELSDRNLDFIFLVFHPAWTPETGILREEVIDWRSSFIRKILDENNVSYIWSKDIIMQKIKDEKLSLSDFFIENDGHPTTHQNKILAERIKNYILKIGDNAQP
jgi:hypothetical protein